MPSEAYLEHLEAQKNKLIEKYETYLKAIKNFVPGEVS